MCGLAIVGILIFVRAAKRPRARARSSSGSALVALGGALQDPVLLRAFGAIFFGYFAASALWSVLGLWLDNRFSMGPREIGLIMALTGMFVALAQSAVTGRLIRRIGAAATITAGLVFAAIFTLAMSLSPWVWLAVGTLTAGVMGQAVWQPASTSLVAANVGSDQRGALLGAAGASGCLARMLGPIAAGALFSAVAPTAPLIFASVMMLPGAWLAWRAGRAARSRQLARTLDAET
jgi:predicted MFS family arabinose efflux permease